jgi:lipopolysaccharide transport system permease protein
MNGSTPSSGLRFPTSSCARGCADEHCPDHPAIDRIEEPNLLAARSLLTPWWTSSVALLRSIVRNRRLTIELSKRELLDRYTGQLFGSAWAILHPALTVLVFLFFFGEVLKVKVGGAHLPANNDFTIYLLSGLLPWLVLQDVLTRGSTLVVNNAHLVKQVAFPLDVLPIKAIPPAFVILLVGLLLLIVYTLMTTFALPATYLVLPLLLVELILLCVGIALFLSALGVFIRDLKDIVQVFSFVGVYVSPIFYTIDTVPAKLRALVFLNPFTPIILTFQDVLFYGSFAHPWAWVVSIVLSVAALLIGARVFNTTQHYFGSYL